VTDDTIEDGPLPEHVFGYVSIASQGGRSVFDSHPWAESTTDAFHGSTYGAAEARRVLADYGLQVLASSPIGMAVVGSPDSFGRLTRGRVVRRERWLYSEVGQRNVTHLDIVGDGQPPSVGLGHVPLRSAQMEGLLLERPRFPFGVAASPLPPPSGRHHLRLPDDLAHVLAADDVHAAGYRGDGVTVAMIDTGHFAHPYFQAHGYAVEAPVTLVPDTDPSLDPLGHGTGESANLFAVAPAARLRPYRASNDACKLVATLAALLRAKADRPSILTNSWGGDTDPSTAPDPTDQAIALELKHAVESGMFVVFSAGNGQFTIEPQVPGVLSAGGVYAAPDGNLRVSDYATAYQSPWYHGVNVPDICGLVGLQPRAQYLMLPVPPGSPIDRLSSAPDGADPGDGTTDDDGWALFSGTSAAAPQVAGAAALLLSARPGLSPLQITEALTSTGTDVGAGRCHPRFNVEATPGRPDVATGRGLLHVGRAIQYALDHF
jgi:hypothetical protein